MASISIKIGETLYPAEINGRLKNPDWDDRDTKAITLKMSYAQAVETFIDGLAWSIVVTRDKPVVDADGKPTGEVETVREEYDNSDYTLAGDITDHRDGTVTVVMGKHTALELAQAQLANYDGITPEELAAAIEEGVDNV